MRLGQLPSLDAAVPLTGYFQAGQLPGESLAGGLSARRLLLRATCSAPAARAWLTFTRLSRRGAGKANKQALVCITHGLLITQGREGWAEL